MDEATRLVGLLKPPKEQGLVTEPRPTILRRLSRFTRRRPQNKQWVTMKKEMVHEMAGGYRGFKKWFKDVVELGD